MTITLLYSYIDICVKKQIPDIPLALSYNDVLLIPQYSKINSRSEVNLSTQITPHVKLTLPLISINMTDVTGPEMAITIGKLGGIGFLPRFLHPIKQAKNVTKVKKAGIKVGAAIGIRDGELERADILVKAGADILTIDIAHGQMQKAISITKILKDKYQNQVDIISGVIATYEGAYALFKAGADSVRVGVGPGTICTTRIVTGVGVPQITALMEANLAAKKFKRTILCDGGTKNSGDIMKGLATGSSAVIIGSQFAGCDEAPGEIIIKNGVKYKQYNASTSYYEKNSHIKNGVSNHKNYIDHIEGVESLVPYKGPLENIIKKITPGIRSGFSYCGAKNLKELWKKAKFIRITSAGFKESEVHDVFIFQK